jgi:threonylcarbamoyladenosine tRNA methylthiotransferase MtaB
VEFNETVDFCASLGFAALHVFPYSTRPGTSAAHFDNHVDAQTKRYRMETLLELAEEQSRIFNQSQIGKEHRVLWEDQYRLNGVQVWRGLTENYARVYCSTDKDLSNTIRSVCIEKYDRGVLWTGLVE